MKLLDYLVLSVGTDGVVPIAVEGVGFQVDGGHLLLRGLQVLGILVGVQHAPDLEPRLCFGGRDQADDGRMSEQGLAAPVLRDK